MTGAEAAPWAFSVEEVRRRMPAAQRVIVLDDDPTGTQTVRDVPVLTSWSRADLDWALGADPHGFFVLTNTRSRTPEDAARINREIVERSSEIAGQRGVQLVYASRGDSTLRGHFPLETDAIGSASADLGRPTDVVLLVPAYIDAGRVTVDGVHLLAGPDGRLPVGESEFARDETFGFRSSRLSDWVQEVSQGRIPDSAVTSVPLEDVRSGRLGDLLRRTSGVVAPDILTEDDARAVAVAALHAEAAGRRIVYRTGPSFVRARLGQTDSLPLRDEELRSLMRPGHGLVVVGSHVRRTTEQLEHLLAAGLETVAEIDVDAVLDGTWDGERVVEQLVEGLRRGTALLSTGRRLRRGTDAASSLAIARAVSAALTETVRTVVDRSAPAFMLVKGGITSSDVATGALGIRRAVVRGSMLPGIVSLWQAVDGPAAGVPYIVFAGNVGSPRALTEVVRRLERAAENEADGRPVLTGSDGASRAPTGRRTGGRGEMETGEDG